MSVDEERPREIVRVRRRQMRSTETRDAIIAAATKEFANLGFDGTTTRAIADRAQIGPNLLLYHFSTKLGIYEAVMEKVLGEYRAVFRKRLEGLRGVDPVTQLRLLQADFIKLAAERPELHWLMSHEAGHASDRLTWIIDNILQESVEVWVKLIASAQKLGAYVEGDPGHLHYAFIGVAARLFMLSAEIKQIIGRDPFAPEFVQEHIDLCQRLFFRDPPSPVVEAAPGRSAKSPRQTPRRSSKSKITAPPE